MIQITREWHDDHIQCCAVDIHGKVIELWWCGWEGLAAAKYANDCSKAFDDLMVIVRAQQESDAADEKEASNGSGG